MKELEASLKVEFNKDGLIVTIGRLEEAYSPARIFVPRESHLAKLIVLDAHIKAKHFGTASTLAELRSCLLYTSPSPRDGLLSRMPSSA